jgi:hypothetical protein
METPPFLEPFRDQQVVEDSMSAEVAIGQQILDISGDEEWPVGTRWGANSIVRDDA